MRREKRIKPVIWVNLAALAMIILSIFFSRQFIDISWDGQWYHAEAIYHLANGWNPVLHPFEFNPDGGAISSLWVAHYPKVIWIIKASIYRLTGDFATTTSVNLMGILAMCFFCTSIFYQFTKKFSLALLFGFLLGINPVFIPQLFTNYADAFLGISLSILIMALLANTFLEDRSFANQITLFFSILLSTNNKFTGVAYVGVIIVSFLFLKALRYQEQIKKDFFMAERVFSHFHCHFGLQPLPD